MVALAFLMPIVASMGGNAGMQTLAVTIRAIAKELSTSNFNRVVAKEFIMNTKWNNICDYNCCYCSFMVQRTKLIFINWRFYDFKYDCSGLIWNFSTSVLKKMNIDPALASSVCDNYN